jgi:haloalkane dehalogenase
VTIEALRTPDERFEGLPGWPYAPHYVDDLPGYEGLRVHYADEGPQNAVRTYLCLHGQPTWSYLYRKMIPVFLDSGARVIAPDWLGFGRSDKPVADDVYTFHFHRDMMLALIERLDLQQVTLVCQDWGGLLGLTLPPDMPDRFERLIVMNTTLATGSSPSQGFNAWKAYSASQPDMDIAALMKRGTPVLSDAEAAAYGAPFPDASYKAGVRRFPELVMVEPGMEGVEDVETRLRLVGAGMARRHLHGRRRGRSCTRAARHGETARADPRLPEPMVIEEAGHFVQEWGAPVAKAALKAFGEL